MMVSDEHVSNFRMQIFIARMGNGVEYGGANLFSTCESLLAVETSSEIRGSGHGNWRYLSRDLVLHLCNAAGGTGSESRRGNAYDRDLYLYHARQPLLSELAVLYLSSHLISIGLCFNARSFGLPEEKKPFCVQDELFTALKRIDGAALPT
jgi:hypothetical protein